MGYSGFLAAPLVDIFLWVELYPNKGVVDGLDAGQVLQAVTVPVPRQRGPEFLHSKPQQHSQTDHVPSMTVSTLLHITLMYLVKLVGVRQ